MAEALIAGGAAICVGLLSLLGVIISNKSANRTIIERMRTAQAVTDERIAELTREVREHNNFAHRMPVVEEQIRAANHRIRELEEEVHRGG